MVVGFGVALGTMNWAIYQAFSRIPLGIAVTIEFVGPLVLAVAGSRRARDLVWIGLAGLGVLLLGFERGDLTVAGVLFALLAGVAWAAYILMSARTGQRWEGLEGLAVASVVALLLLSPLALLLGTLPDRRRPRWTLHPQSAWGRGQTTKINLVEPFHGCGIDEIMTPTLTSVQSRRFRRRRAR